MQFVAPYSLISSGNLALHLHADHLADLRASGLTDETISAAGVYSLRPCDFAQFFNLRRGVPKELQTALCFPYQSGEFARIKLFPPLGKMKYAQPPKTSARLYIPFPVRAGDIVVCEGEKKTLAAQQAGLNAVGAGGIWSWLSNGEPIDDLKLIEWDGRETTIIFDSDIFCRVDLLRATYALGQELRRLGANVFIAQIPQDGDAKVGLDDCLIAGGDIAELEVFALSNRIFKSTAYWHSQWKFKKTIRQAA
jgi:putative DNA primase/helicase